MERCSVYIDCNPYFDCIKISSYNTTGFVKDYFAPEMLQEPVAYIGYAPSVRNAMEAGYAPAVPLPATLGWADVVISKNHCVYDAYLGFRLSEEDWLAWNTIDGI